MNTQVPSILWLHHFPGSASRQKKRKNVEKAHLLLYCLVQERSKSLLIFNWWEQVTWLFLAAGVAGKCSYWLGCDPIPQNSIERTLYHRREACSLMDSRPALPEGPADMPSERGPGECSEEWDHVFALCLQPVVPDTTQPMKWSEWVWAVSSPTACGVGPRR